MNWEPWCLQARCTYGLLRRVQTPAWGGCKIIELSLCWLLLMAYSLLFQLHGSHAAQSLFSLDALFLAGLQDFFVFNTEFASLNIEAIECCHDGISVLRGTEISKSESTESTRLV
jgi:hypothetical protein